MASEITLQVRCDRCSRLETRPLEDEKKRIAEGSASAQFKASLTPRGGKPHTVEIGDLCGPCENTVSNLLAQIGKKVEKKSPNRVSAKKS